MRHQLQPIDFPECNGLLVCPDDMPECGPLHICRCNGEIISLWAVPWRARLALLLTGRIWLHVWGITQPPVAVVVGSPFEEAAP